MEDLLQAIVRGLVNYPDKIRIDVDKSAQDGLVVYRVVVDDSDTGRVIGKRGRIAKSIRQVVKVAAAKKNLRVAVEIG